jgi:DNA-binding response OmpR family regulator
LVQKVLVVENYADLNSAITSALPDDCNCTSVRTSEEAILRLREGHYEVILLAPRLPIQDDPVMHFLHEYQPEEIAKVILMTDPGDADGSGEDCRVLVKPFNREELVAKVTGGE